MSTTVSLLLGSQIVLSVTTTDSFGSPTRHSVSQDAFEWRGLSETLFGASPSLPPVFGHTSTSEFQQAPKQQQQGWYCAAFPFGPHEGYTSNVPDAKAGVR